jgi:glycosyltransferase involved in cell wall biosynthesis
LDKLKISVAMAVYNGSKFIKDQVLSILEQSRRPDELIIVDDCSSDDSWKIIKELENQFSEIIHSTKNQKNIGYVGTFNIALSKATGDLIFLSDQDDFWYSNKIEEVVKFSNSNLQYAVIQHDVDLVNESLQKSGFSFLGQIKSVNASIESAVLGCAMVVRKPFLQKCLPIPSDFTAHDIWINEFAEQFDLKGILPSALIAYRRHQDNESGHVLFSQKKLSPFDFKFNYYVEIFKRDKKSSLERRLIDRKLIQTRYVEFSKDPNFEFDAFLPKKLAQIQAEIESLEMRSSINKRKFLFKILGFCQLAINGGYKNSLGLKSYLRDLSGLS